MGEFEKSCVNCGVLNCAKRDKEYPEFCLTTNFDVKELEEIKKLYLEDEENNKVSVISAEIEAEFYCRYTRVEEIIEFSKRMGFHKIGIATCIGLIEESRIFAQILRKNGFEPYAALCKAGAFNKTDIGVRKEYTTQVGNALCNPIMQAKLLEKAGTDFNVVVGLCVGHDSLFYKYTHTLTTTLVTKDRVLAHNPVGALYQRMSGEPAQNIADTVATGQMKVTYLNVGQGDCTIIQTEGHNAMIDAGNNHEGKDVVDYLNQQGIDKLDYLILTHPDADHIGGGDDVLEKIEVEQVIMPDVANDTMTYEEVMDDIEKENVPVEHPKVGEEFGFGDATFTVLCPETDLVSSDDTNDASVGIKLVHGENSFVMCGDASEKSESAMVKRFGSALECDVLKCGHHGSRTSTSEVFLKATNPTWAVISCGVDNSYGHPHQETLERLNNDDVQVYRTDLLGTIIATSDGTNISWFSEKE